MVPTTQQLSARQAATVVALPAHSFGALLIPGAHQPARRLTALGHALRLAAFLVFSAWARVEAAPSALPIDPSLATDAGYQDFAFGAGTLAIPTADKPQSKLWWTDGSWWGCLWDPVALSHRIQRFDFVAHTWTSVGPNADNRADVIVDVLWAGAKLYIVSHPYEASGEFRLHSYTYDSTTDIYTLRSGFPMVMNSGDAEAVTIAKDGTGKLWTSWEEDGDIMINRSTSGDASWGTPFRLPVQGADTSSDDISSIVSFGSRIGVMWSNQDDSKVYFASHSDGQADTVWQAREDALADAVLGIVADDHLNLAVACDANACVYAVAKTSLHGVGLPQLYLLRRDNTGIWTRYPVANDEDDHTRPILLIDDQNRKLYVFARSGTGDNGIYMKVSDLDNIAFGAGVGVPFIVRQTAPEMNNPTSTKQTVNGTTDLLVVASDEDSRYYFHNKVDLPNGTPTPDIAMSPLLYAYGDVLVGSSAAKTFVVQNTGTATLQVTATSVTGSNANQFSITSGGGSFSLAPGGTRNVVVSFAPTSTGAKTAALRCASNDPDENPYDVALTGTGTQPDIAASPTSYGYGNLPVGSSASTTLVVQNTGSATLQVTATTLIGTHPGQFSITSGGGSFSLAPGSTRNVVVAFVPTSTGDKSATLRLTSNDTDESPLNLPLTGTAITPAPDIVVLPGLLDCGNVLVGTNSLGAIRVRNAGGGSLQVTATWLAGPDSTAFALTAGVAPFALAPGDSTLLQLRFAPASGGSKSAVLHIESNDPDENPVLILVTGSGVVPLPDLQAASSHAFGYVGVGSSQTDTLAIDNVGLADLHVTSTSLLGPDAAQFGLPGPGAFTVTPSASHALVVAFSPGTLGPKSATLRLASDDPDAGVWDIALQGSGGAPDLAVSPLARDFGACDIGSSASFMAQLWNQGTLSLDVTSTMLMGTNAAEFGITSGAGPFTLAPGDSQQVVVRFAPTTFGPKSASLMISSTDPVDGNILIQLTGSGNPMAAATVAFEGSSSGGSTGALSVSTASAVPAAGNQLYLAAISTKDHQGVVGVAGMGLTWTRVLAQCGARSATGIEVWMGRGSPVSGVVTATFAAAPSNAVILVSRYSGTDANGPFGAMLSANTLGLSGPCDGGTDSAAFSIPFTTTASHSVGYAAVAIRQKVLSPGVTWTQRDILQVGSGGNRCGVAVMDQALPGGPGTVPLDGTFNDSVDWAVIGLEIVAGGGLATDAPTGVRDAQEAALWIQGGIGPSPLHIEVAVPSATASRLTLHDIRGRLVDTLWQGVLPGGRYGLDLPADPAIPSGIYFLRAELGARRLSRRVLLLR